MPWVAAAATVVGGAIGGASSKSASSQSADAAQRASEEGNVALQEQLARQESWRASGIKANNKLSAMLGLAGPATPFNSDDPGYAFRLAEGQKQVDNSAAARGSTLSGGVLKALQKYGQGMASQEFQNSFNRLSGVSTLGQNTATNQAGQSMQSSAQQGANTRAAGDATAAGTIGEGNAWANTTNSLVNQYQNNQTMDLYKKKGTVGSSMDWYNKR